MSQQPHQYIARMEALKTQLQVLYYFQSLKYQIF
jgi:hypothetical protein